MYDAHNIDIKMLMVKINKRPSAAGRNDNGLLATYKPQSEPTIILMSALCTKSKANAAECNACPLNHATTV